MVEPSVLEFAGLLRQLRAQAGLTQEELAEAAQVSPRYVIHGDRGVFRGLGCGWPVLDDTLSVSDSGRPSP